MKWMIYGAYGYTGELISRHAVAEGHKPVLAGRNGEAVRKLAEELDRDYVVVSLDEPGALEAALADMDLVIHCAGPFEVTAEPMIASCLATKTHYLDITGEISVFEFAHASHKLAESAGVVLCPGVGFDVIPTDCVAAQLKEQLPDAIDLVLGFDSSSRMSRGTARTGMRKLAEGGAVRRGGDVVNVPLAYHTRKIDFGNGEKCAMTIPWGDVATAYYTTSIPNIEVYIPASPRLIKRMKRMNWFRWLFRFKPLRNMLEKNIEQQPAGPDEEEREKAVTYVWGEAKNGKGDSKSLRVKVMNGYKLTSQGAVDVAMHILEQRPAPGYYTPAKLCGSDLIDRYKIE
ncbi:membrane protein [Pseudidiomarina salinarum]|uniref:Membrane protein n=1 Tax=Pseudidiomarina salinarum TaxID=435908 RepID=A0A094JEK2_9GAMM|nr:saccharopine dehydrogenase NADP-binding domain-containing protein [Pseudidiomarina salinarum]KFZ30996.1 membrane protein [Pseudidiomarina salinarum]RUO71480.1 hypothetical protein CWI79_08655 [Pseudidiomarina salinarum]